MGKQNNYEDPKLNDEFDGIYSKLDLYVISITAPARPSVGTIWFNPKDRTLKIWDGQQFNSY